MKSIVRPLVVMFGVLTLVTGIVYPLVVTAIAKAAFADQAAGSLIVSGGKLVGSALIGQTFVDPKHFWGRPSATSPMPTNAANSGGSNLGPLNPALVAAVRGRIAALNAVDPGNALPIPVDLVSASGSGLDPEISIAAAEYQAARVARARGIPLEQVRTLIVAHSERQRFGFLGEPRVNVLRLNLALEAAR
ncbi:MAG: potassium-transporting ATPase subunit KdpC [Caldimonas sp.]